MTASRFTGGVELATGIGLRSPHYKHILSEKPTVGWFEIISENYMVEGGRPLEVLDMILEQYRVVQHGVGLYPGNAHGVDRDHLKRLKRLIRRTNTPWISDHLCWGSIDGSMSHDLLPIPFTFEAARKTAANLRMVQDFLEVPLAMENVSSYGEFNGDEMTEWEFLAEVCELADVGILLDVNNIFVSSVNNEFDPMEYVDFVPPERVAQIHIAGHSRYERFIVDTHDHPVIDPVWKLYERAIERCGPVATLLEWDGRIPSFEEVWTEARKSETWRASALAKKGDDAAA
ncbi:DUF692 domain-containing protein [Luteolibacter yonseiensis]|uniref:DUF692 domain-containing protein n=1 Tax=Luteolibacter yonseiensis TaxID=1144680 RepID=A0A934VCR1_9BACT|nr:DUF692 domain-containing protein [Luteolibacter yonseiensis]MBK1817236.1 DUF692 domain-containing protein [Luteolibacter yonseiensis]